MFSAQHQVLPCFLQFYLGTTRLQLEHKGGPDHVVTAIANVVPAFGFVGIPVIAWLLDKMGYGITLATINFLGVLASFFQAMPSVWFQVGCRSHAHTRMHAHMHANRPPPVEHQASLPLHGSSGCQTRWAVVLPCPPSICWACSAQHLAPAAAPRSVSHRPH